jgi:hypothetical protein
MTSTPFDITSWVTGPATVLTRTKELVILGVEFKGIIMSNHENKVLDNFNSHFVGISRIMDGQVNGHGYFKLTDLGGDFIFIETKTSGPVEKPTWKWHLFQGTGKWEGIDGEADVTTITARNPLEEGTWRAAYRVIGSFELTK